ncbi:MAG: hypothetical protein H0X34_09075 [Chthoniobacterales bacterium]|nr:hypothetical protein [Chthoniobacterales bacterium]
MISSRKNYWSRLSALVLATLIVLQVCVSSAQARRNEEPVVFAKSAEDPVLRHRVATLAPGVDPEEARLAVSTAYTTGRELARKWRVLWPPGLQNFLVNTGARKGGLCFQWATELLIRLDALQLKTLELHWAESYPGTASEHNVIVVTGKGQPFSQGILFDNWRYSGRLAWGPVNGDPEYEWKENQVELTGRLARIRSESAHRPKTAAKTETSAGL